MKLGDLSGYVTRVLTEDPHLTRLVSYKRVLNDFESIIKSIITSFHLVDKNRIPSKEKESIKSIKDFVLRLSVANGLLQYGCTDDLNASIDLSEKVGSDPQIFAAIESLILTCKTLIEMYNKRRDREREGDYSSKRRRTFSLTTPIFSISPKGVPLRNFQENTNRTYASPTSNAGNSSQNNGTSNKSTNSAPTKRNSESENKEAALLLQKNRLTRSASVVLHKKPHFGMQDNSNASKLRELKLQRTASGKSLELGQTNGAKQYLGTSQSGNDQYKTDHHLGKKKQCLISIQKEGRIIMSIAITEEELKKLEEQAKVNISKRGQENGHNDNVSNDIAALKDLIKNRNQQQQFNAALDESISKKYKQQKKELEQSQADLKSARDLMGAMKGETESLKIKNAELTTELRLTKQKLEELQNAKDKVELSIKQKAEALDKSEKALERSEREYKTLQETKKKIELDTAQKIKQLQTDVKQAQTDKQDKASEIEKISKESSDKQQALSSQITKLVGIINHYKTDVASLEAETDRLKQERGELVKLMKELNEENDRLTKQHTEMLCSDLTEEEIRELLPDYDRIKTPSLQQLASKPSANVVFQIVPQNTNSLGQNGQQNLTQNGTKDSATKDSAANGGTVNGIHGVSGTTNNAGTLNKAGSSSNLNGNSAAPAKKKL